MNKVSVVISEEEILQGFADITKSDTMIELFDYKHDKLPSKYIPLHRIISIEVLE